MCILLGLTDHPDYSLILISNRDEVYQRKAERTAVRNLKNTYNNSPARVLCPVDELSGGTWLGINLDTKVFSIVLNIQELENNPNDNKQHNKGLLSRGILPLICLLNDNNNNKNNGNGNSDKLSSKADWLNTYPDIIKTRPFNLVYGDLSRNKCDLNILSLKSDATHTDTNLTEELKHYKINSTNDTTFVITNNKYSENIKDWPKIKLGQDALDELRNTKTDNIIEKCYEIATRTTLPDHRNILTSKECKALVRNSIFIPPLKVKNEDDPTIIDYGTRTTIVITVSRKTGDITYVERDNVEKNNADLIFTESTYQ
ncbi:uncharacterized protein SCDLUD_002382 [Saccharomycodes ludwigii]|uniref:uncharacterized protein n=1 Tax=Saccharomycodes ludwigii TaxID=36035 RepID=UPI001E84989C|nr:hypothetical protein SCDLUD_002382 [Saccharomycodes ludwigii]KAH3900922.1 hypothetical protein SCDLUD_002382 [Saccharomycodes ludwigii]